MAQFTRALALAATGLALFPIAAPAQARSSKPTTVRLPASSLKDPAAKLCMPKSMIRNPAAGTPDTVCQTQSEWTAAGVNIVAR